MATFRAVWQPVPMMAPNHPRFLEFTPWGIVPAHILPQLVCVTNSIQQKGWHITFKIRLLSFLFTGSLLLALGKPINHVIEMPLGKKKKRDFQSIDHGESKPTKKQYGRAQSRSCSSRWASWDTETTTSVKPLWVLDPQKWGIDNCVVSSY